MLVKVIRYYTYQSMIWVVRTGMVPNNTHTSRVIYVTSKATPPRKTVTVIIGGWAYAFKR